MRRIVDASALIDAVLPSTRQHAALAALAGHDLAAPGIIDLEVMSAIWRLARAGEISSDEADRAVEGARSAPIRRIHEPAVSVQAWMLRHALRLSDAHYVAAARLFAAELVTSDARLSRAPSLGVTVVLLR